MITFVSQDQTQRYTVRDTTFRAPGTTWYSESLKKEVDLSDMNNYHLQNALTKCNNRANEERANLRTVAPRVALELSALTDAQFAAIVCPQLNDIQAEIAYRIQSNTWFQPAVVEATATPATVQDLTTLVTQEVIKQLQLLGALPNTPAKPPIQPTPATDVSLPEDDVENIAFEIQGFLDAQPSNSPLMALLTEEDLEYANHNETLFAISEQVANTLVDGGVTYADFNEGASSFAFDALMFVTQDMKTLALVLGCLSSWERGGELSKAQVKLFVDAQDSFGAWYYDVAHMRSLRKGSVATEASTIFKKLVTRVIEGRFVTNFAASMLELQSLSGIYSKVIALIGDDVQVLAILNEADLADDLFTHGPLHGSISKVKAEIAEALGKNPQYSLRRLYAYMHSDFSSASTEIDEALLRDLIAEA